MHAFNVSARARAREGIRVYEPRRSVVPYADVNGGELRGSKGTPRDSSRDERGGIPTDALAGRRRASKGAGGRSKLKERATSLAMCRFCRLVVRRKAIPAHDRRG